MIFLSQSQPIFMMVAVVAKKTFILCLFLFPLSYSAENISCIIKLGGFKIGTLSAVHINSKNMDYYTIISNVELSLIIKIKVYYKTETIYKDGALIKSTVSSLVNGKNYNSSTYWNGNRYIINCETHKYKYSDTTITKPINWSVSKLYFKKPNEGAEVYAETYGKLASLKTERVNYFKVEIPKSKQIYFYNKEGNLENVEMINTIKNFKVERIL